jgi:D-alanine transaminase
MPRIPQRVSYVNGRYVLHRQAKVHIDDRGYHFADGVYEVIAFQNGVLIDGKPHFERLKRSLQSLRIALPCSIRIMEGIIQELCRLNHLKDGAVYLQITRGVVKRDHLFPKKRVMPSLVVTVMPPKAPNPKEYSQGVGIISHPETRWTRRDIKSISLLPNILAKQAAAEKKAKEAWFVTEKGLVTEGASSNAYIVDAKGTLRTHPLSTDILGGITRDTVLRLARKAGITVVEKPFTFAEAKKAKEAFMTSTTAGVLPITRLDGRPIGMGKPGETTRLLLQLYGEYVSTLTRGSHDRRKKGRK